MKKIIIIGTGNVAHHLGVALKNAEHQIDCVIGRTEKNAKVLAEKLDANFSTEICNAKDADLVIIAVNDDAILEVSLQIKGIPFAHTSGSVSLENGGVFYPLQTFSKAVDVDVKNAPFCISATDKNLEKSLFELAETISEKVYCVDNKQRQILHLAAVFSCNFSNKMYAIAEEILNDNNLDFEMLKPLIIETANKIKSDFPKNLQTGPAIRGDEKTIQNHLSLIEDEKIKELYQKISESIIKTHE